MASYSSKKEGRRTFSGNHQRSWLWGHHAVTETMRAGKWPILEIFATREMIEQSAEIRLAQSQASVSIEVVSASRLEQLVRSNEHQGSSPDWESSVFNAPGAVIAGATCNAECCSAFIFDAGRMPTCLRWWLYVIESRMLLTSVPSYDVAKVRQCAELL